MKNAFLRMNGPKPGSIKKNSLSTGIIIILILVVIWAYTCRNFGGSSRAPVVECEHNSFITLRWLSVNQLTVR